MYDSNPTKLHQGNTHNKLMNLRPRKEEKEIGPASFRYQSDASRANNYLKRIQNYDAQRTKLVSSQLSHRKEEGKKDEEVGDYMRETIETLDPRTRMEKMRNTLNGPGSADYSAKGNSYQNYLASQRLKKQ